jgi:CheY-like chemotaxis protein
LLVDDNDIQLMVLADGLRGQGNLVEVARNGLEALARAQTTPPDLILMDIQMPGMDGLEAIRRLRADARLAATPIIALTALVMPGDRERCLAAGASLYLSKPVSLQTLLHVIETLGAPSHL